ncbi:hypothetical protein AWQ21_15325 (plasmid) [Picosynechococcus sp. PCC 7003]|uniref:hypothetical protein n=1 Tax=Picosynechococcus sp. PCC 7003 TaxID=374981 RepID=UPI000810B20F|nr:hypothetical protein [Picosynechococcus sp. PCC 7003]ANV85899.1 hypothetical protein AWQ21_15325 [Picosynechococcus sp. PCC 7003]
MFQTLTKNSAAIAFVLLGSITFAPGATSQTSTTPLLQAEDFQGLVYYQDPNTRGMPINLPGIFIGLPREASSQGGWLLDIPNNDVFAPSSLGVNIFQFDQQYFLFFDSIANFDDGRAYSRILDVIEIPADVVLLRCLESASETSETIAFLNTEEQAIVEAQAPSAMDGILAELQNPTMLYSVDSRRLSIEAISGEGFTCRSFSPIYINLE